MYNTKELMHCHCGTNNRAPRLTFTDPCKQEVRPGAREESASPAWLAASAMNARDTKKVYIWRFDTGCGPTLYRKRHSHKTHIFASQGSDPLPSSMREEGSGSEPWLAKMQHQEKVIITLESNPSQGTVLPAPHGKGNKCDKNVKYKRTVALSLWHQQ